MSSYFIDFTAFVDERKRPENFLKEIHIHEIYQNVRDLEHIQAIVNKRFVELISAPGLIAIKNTNEILDGSQITFDKRTFVPWHMITHMQVNVRLMQELTTQDPLVPGTEDKEEKPKKALVQ